MTLCESELIHSRLLVPNGSTKKRKASWLSVFLCVVSFRQGVVSYASLLLIQWREYLINKLKVISYENTKPNLTSPQPIYAFDSLL